MTASKIITKAIKEHGPLKLRGLVVHTSLPLGTISNAVWRMQAAGQLVKLKRVHSSLVMGKFPAVVYDLPKEAPKPKLLVKPRVVEPVVAPRCSSVWAMGELAAGTSREL